MGAVGVVAVAPAFDVELGIAQREEPVLVQALVAESAVEALDESVFRWACPAG